MKFCGMIFGLFNGTFILFPAIKSNYANEFQNKLDLKFI